MYGSVTRLCRKARKPDISGDQLPLEMFLPWCLRHEGLQLLKLCNVQDDHQAKIDNTTTLILFLFGLPADYYTQCLCRAVCVVAWSLRPVCTARLPQAYPTPICIFGLVKTLYYSSRSFNFYLLKPKLDLRHGNNHI
jgi:hypothetical protein